MSDNPTPVSSAPSQPAEPVWAKPGVSVYAMTIFLVAFGVAYMSKDSSSLTMMMGATIAMAQQVVNYWMGSSSGSSKKTDVIAASQPPVKPVGGTP